MMDFLQECAKRQIGKDSLKALRKSAWEAFLTKGLPDKKNEDFQYFPLRAFYETEFSSPAAFSAEEISSHVLPECAASYLVFVDGKYQPSLSNHTGFSSKPVIQPLDEAMGSYASFIQQRWTRELKEEKDPFYLLNCALHEKGSFLFFPPKYKASTPLQILHFVTGGCSFPRVEVALGAEAEVQLVTKTVSSNGAWVNSALSLSLDNASHCLHTSILEENESSFHFSCVRASVKKDASFRAISVLQGSKGTRQDFRVNLIGENADCQLNGISMLSGSKHASINVLVSHLAPRTTSMQLFKGVLEDVSQSSFQGQIFVAREAQKTQAYQLNNNILLGERAIANSKPNLQIFADDVKASHGATVAQLDKNQLFYLKSRGVPLKEAKLLLLLGFCKEVLEKIPQPSLQNRSFGLLNNYLAYATKN